MVPKAYAAPRLDPYNHPMAMIPATHRRVFLAWGCVIAVLVVLAIPFSPEKRPAAIPASQWVLWIAAFAAFLALFWLGQYASSRAARWLLTGGQTSFVLVIISTRPALGFEGALFVLVAFELASEETPRLALAWIALQSLALFVILALRFGPEHSLGVFAAYFPFQLLAFYTSRVLASEARAREDLARVNAELLGTRERLAEHSRAAERLRISRELHDVFGHRLAALTLNLEAAARVGDGRRFIGRAHESAKALLADVREVVANLRRDAPVDVCGRIRALASEIPRPSIHFDCPGGLPLFDPGSARLIVGCAQEMMTNSIKHSASENLWIRMQCTPLGLEIVAEDDGRGADAIREGNGLRGIRERIESAGGSMRIETERQRGFRVRLVVPGIAHDQGLPGRG